MLLQWWRDWRAKHVTDDTIDELIAKNTAQPREDMHVVDYRKLELAGARVWQQTLRAQRRQNGR